jgi:hypothetical protein
LTALYLNVFMLLAAAGTPPPFQVGVCVSARGMDAAAVSATRAKIAAEVESLGAEVLPSTEEQGNCCTTPACLRDLELRGAAGLVEISILRFGSVIRINVQFYSAGLQKQVIHVKAKASAANFPASASLRGVLEKGLQSLRPQPKPEIQEPVEEPITEVVAPLPEPAKEPEVAGVVEKKRDLTWYWVGGGLATGGAILAGVGLYLLLGPMQDALDRRDRAYESWMVATQPAEIDRYRSEMKDQDERASSCYTLGWVGTGVGAAMVVGGLLVILLVPESEAVPRVGPMALRGGGGIVLQWSF